MQYKSPNNSEWIDVLEILSKIYSEKKRIIKFTIYTAIFGLIVALVSPNKFTSKTTFVPQISSDTSNKSIAGLASIAGIDLPSGSDVSEISPYLYPEIIESVPFRLELLNSEIIFESKKLSLRTFLTNYKSFNPVGFIKKYTIGIPSLISKYFFNKKIDNIYLDQIYFIDEEDQILFDVLDNILKIELNEKDRFITISSTHKNKIIPPQITKNAQLILQNKIIEYKIMYSKEILEFSENQYQIKRDELNKLQDDIAIFKDKNININSFLYQNNLNRLLSESQILQSVVQQLASQVEQAKLKVNKDTPVFTVIKPVNVPYKKSSISKLSIVIIFSLLGFILSIIYVCLKSPITELFIKIKD